MAWTSSAGPEGTFALADGADEHCIPSKSAAYMEHRVGNSSRPLALATLAHLSGLAIVAPFADSNPILAIPAVIGLTVSFLTHSHSFSFKNGSIDNAQVPFTSQSPSTRSDEIADISLSVLNDNPAAVELPTPGQPQTRGQSNIIALPMAPFDGAEVSSELRADLMARVSHEFRTPLNAVMGFSDLMGHQLFGPLGHPRYEEYVTHIRESSQKLLKSAEDTLAMTSLMAKSAGHCEREPLALGSLCKDAKTVVAIDLDRRAIICNIDIDPEIEVIAHRRALRQALVNTMCEAISQAEDGATVTIRASTDLDRVALLVLIDRTTPRTPEEHRSLSICLARTLLELDGCQLYEDAAANAPWSVLLSLDGVIQQELFATSHAH